MILYRSRIEVLLLNNKMVEKDKIVEDKQKYWDSMATLYDARV
jgi:hypothetical protein